MAEPRQRLARRPIAQFRFVAEGEEGLLAAGAGAGAGDRQHLPGIQIHRLAAPRRVREGAVMAHVAAQLRQRDEHLPRIGDERPMPLVAQRGGDRHQRVQVAHIGEHQRRFGFEPRPSRRPVENCR